MVVIHNMVLTASSQPMPLEYCLSLSADNLLTSLTVEVVSQECFRKHPIQQIVVYI